MNGLLDCARCRHGLLAHGDLRCEERGCDCSLSHRTALENEIVKARASDRLKASSAATRTVGASIVDVGCMVRELRLERGWSQTRLSVVSGVERTTVQRIESGKRGDPGFSIVVRLARAFEVSLETFDL